MKTDGSNYKDSHNSSPYPWGYITKKVKLNPGTRVLNVKLQPDDIMLSEVVVKPKKEKYSRCV